MNANLARKSKQLGMSFSKASHILRKSVMFHLAQRCGLDFCFRCGKRIEHVDDFTLEHKQPWLYAYCPLELFFDIDNIAFSHRRCNSLHRRRKLSLEGTSGYKGVIRTSNARQKKRWEARIFFRGKDRFLGRYSTPQEAARAYDAAAIRLLKGEAITNRSLGLL
jgi:hypothetical protein